MKKISWVLGAVLITAGCGVNQSVEQAFQISNGMTKSEVLNVMGAYPVANEFHGSLEEWHFCKSGSISKFVAVFFDNGRVFAMKPYNVMLRNEGGESLDSCDGYIKKGNYKEPDIVREYRVRYRRG